ncbi:hypothetical protein RND81_13G022800 [Saponaria officinalis]|uniref:Cucumopine synthase C-terminal helical bundle domain-containing protein n=1 Tax=Saponaria officinalis TaxID=3572 RepID=A0AAW1GT73_SAPOF
MAVKTLTNSETPVTYATLTDLIEAIIAATEAVQSTEPKGIYELRTGKLKIGTMNQYYTTWDFANSLIRDLSMTWYSLYRTFEDPTFSLDQCCALVDRFDYATSNFLRYSGFPEMGGFASALSQHLPSSETREMALKGVRAFLKYLNILTAWSFHYFPWNIGRHLSYIEGRTAPTDLSRRVRVIDGQRVRLSWEPLGISVVAVIASKENPELAKDIVEALPFRIMMDHAVVCGASMYAWAPVVSTAPVRVKERQCDAPVGRIRFSQGTGQKIIVQYGEVTEDILSPVLGEVLPEYADSIIKVGAAVLKATMETKDIIWLTMQLI